MTLYTRLCILIALLVANLALAYWQHRKLVQWLDALGDMTGDMLRAILNR